MRLTIPLCKQHLERMARRHWYIQGKKRVLPTKAEEYVTTNGKVVVDAVQEFINPPKPVIDFDMKAVQETALDLDETHPDYKNDACYVYGDSNVLLGGLKQAQLLTNSVMVGHSLPSNLVTASEAMAISPNLHDELKIKILQSCVFDAEQNKLPKKKDPSRPAFNFPRDYGITDTRKNELICRNLLQLCDQTLKSRDLSLIENAKFSLPLNAHDKSMQLELSSELLVVSKAALKSYTGPKVAAEMPVIHPLHCTVSLQPSHFYSLQDIYPPAVKGKWKHCHTAIIQYNPTKVSNLYDAPVNADQIAARLLMKAFCIASSQARALQTQEPVTIQAIHTDGQFFSFMVYQLNSTDVEGGKKNLFWMDAPIPLYWNCAYVSGRPCLEGYNPRVLPTVLSLLSNR